MSATKLMKQIKSKFNFENVKQIFNGKLKTMKYTDGKFVNMVPTGVVYNNKINQNQLEQVNAKLKEIKTFLCDELFCELETFYENEGLVADFKASKSTYYSISAKVHHLNNNLDDEHNDSKQVYIEIFLIKC